MPYITGQQRDLEVENVYTGDSLDTIARSVGKHCKSGGELNFVFTQIIAAYLDSMGVRYQNISDVVGALEGAKMEFYRVIVNDYEEEKIQENGKVYGAN
jgi:hypothetical protein